MPEMSNLRLCLSLAGLGAMAVKQLLFPHDAMRTLPPPSFMHSTSRVDTTQLLPGIVSSSLADDQMMIELKELLKPPVRHTIVRPSITRALLLDQHPNAPAQ